MNIYIKIMSAMLNKSRFICKLPFALYMNTLLFRNNENMKISEQIKTMVRDWIRDSLQ